MLNRNGRNNRSCSEGEIDLFECIRVFIKRIKTFLLVFVPIFIIGVTWSKFLPDMCRVSISIFPPIGNDRLLEVNDSEFFNKLNSLINNQAYTEELKKESNSLFKDESIEFKAENTGKDNIMRISVDLEKNKKEMGVLMLRDLAALISESYRTNIQINISYIVNQINQNEQAIKDYKEKIKKLEDQISKITLRESKLIEELKVINRNTAQILDKCEALLKTNSTLDKTVVLPVTRYQENNSRYLNMVEKELRNLSAKRDTITLEIQDAASKIGKLQTTIYELTKTKDFISSSLIISTPKILSNFPDSKKKRILILSVNTALFLGVLAVFLQEYLAHRLSHE